MNTYHNEHKTIKEQIEILESRNVIVDDEEVLKLVNYSHLMYKYGKHFLDTTKEDIHYKEGTKISHIYNFFLLNNEISLLILKTIIKFEHLLK